MTDKKRVFKRTKITTGRPVSVSTYLKRMRVCSECNDPEGVLRNLRQGVVSAMQNNPRVFNHGGASMLLQILNTEMALKRMEQRLQDKGDMDDDENLKDYLSRLEQSTEE